MFKTALCPDKCNHSKEIAKFKIVEYLEYIKSGEYGDEKQEYFYCDMNINAIEDKQKKEFIDFIKTLKEGDKVKLIWDVFMLIIMVQDILKDQLDLLVKFNILIIFFIIYLF